MKLLKNLLGLILLLALVLPIVYKNKLVTEGVTKGIIKTTELKPEIGSLNVDLLAGKIFITDLKIYNAGKFKDQVFAEMPEVEIDYQLTSLLQGKLHSQIVTINAEKIYIRRDAGGAVSLNTIKGVNVDQITAEGLVAGEDKAADITDNIQIDRVRLKIGTVNYFDEESGDSKEIVAKIVRNFKDVTNPNVIFQIIASEAVTNTELSEFFITATTAVVKEASEDEMIIGEDKAQKVLTTTVENWKGAIQQIKN